MNKKLVFLSLISLLLSSCSKKNVVNLNLLPELQAEANASKAVIPYSQVINNWPDSVNFVNTENNNFNINKVSGFSKIKLTKRIISAPPIIAENKIFVLNDCAEITSYDLKTMKTLWSDKIEHKNKCGFIGGGIVYKDSKLYISYGSRNLAILNANNGYEILRKQLPDLVKSSPVVYNNLVIVLTVSNQLYCIDSLSGNVIWEHEVAPEILTTNSLVTPLIYKNQVIVGYSSGQVLGLDLRNGQVLWQMNFNNDSNPLIDFSPANLVSQPIIKDKALYIAGNNGKLICTNLETGSTIWVKEIFDINNFNLIGNALFITTSSGKLIAVSARDGKIIWVTNLYPNSKAGMKYILTPIAINNDIAAISGATYYTISPNNGQIISKIPIEKNPKFFAVSNRLYIFGNQYVNISR